MMFAFAIVAFLGLVLRYAVLSGIPYWYFWKEHPERFASKRIQKRPPAQSQLDSEIKWSLATFLVFSAAAALLYPVVMQGHTRLYFTVSERGWPYFFASILLSILLHDAYFYFAHRFMHLKWVFKHVHRIHHQSTNPSPLAAFSFHPLEAVIEGLFAFGLIFLIPIHIGALALFIVFSHSMNVMGHLGYEFFPKSWSWTFPLSLINSSTHHNLHHSRFQGNYGLYFTFWDKLFDTELVMEPNPSFKSVQPLPKHVVDFRDQFRKERLSGRFYSGALHLAFTSAVAITTVTYSLLHVSHPSWLELLVVPVTFLYANMVEYWGHRIPMHNKVRFLEVIFQRHACEHHRYYTHDAMDALDHRDFGIILFPPVMIVFFFGLFAVPVAAVLHHFATANCGYLFLAAAMAYFINYEWFHFAYHMPEDSWLRRLPFMATFRRLHASHHDPRLMTRYCFNITWPIGDLIFGTYRVKLCPSDEAKRPTGPATAPSSPRKSS